ncbi:MAG: hypothetical protein HYR68_05490 [Burkholderiales bacterium]|nr:hypothetical protein [Burkholderiales bacterium]MBI3728893.1 hypothetical protein [Burkholderiales bacterium]
MKTSISRYRASATHFFLSCMVGLCLLLMCWFMWYPSPMLSAIGGYEIFFLIVGIDVVLGPALTLVVFNPKKKWLVLDLAVIAIVQISAFLYGVSTLLEARPAYIAALGKSFQVIQASEITDTNLNKAKTTLPLWGPKLVSVKEPTEFADVSAAQAMESVGGGKGHMPHLHIPYADMKDEILKNALDFEALEKDNADKKSEIQAWLKSNGCDEKTCKYQPIKIRVSTFPAVIDAKTAAYKGIMPIALKL